ncbi:putative wall-associated receptor kinase-like 16 [Fagus crenata]
MGLPGMQTRITLIGVIISAIMAANAAAALAKPDCPDKCGDVEIPFPFGMTEDCYLDKSFNITCDNNTARVGTVPVTHISIESHELRVFQYVARDCYNSTGTLTNVKNQLSIIAPEQKTVLTPKGVIIIVAPNGTTEMEEKTVKAVLRISY